MKYITIDLWKPYHAPIEVVQREAGARTLAFQITDGGAALDLTGKVVTFYATKPDDSILFNACTITSAATGKCTYLMTAQTCAVAGTLSCTLVITGASYEARTQPFTITVVASPDYTSSVESSDEFTALSTAVGLVADHESRLTAAEGDIDALETGKQAVVSGVSDAEIGYLANVTADIQTQLNAKAAAAQENKIAPTLLGTWVNQGSTYEGVSYWKDTMGYVHLQGCAKSGTIGTVMFTMPAGYRPAADLMFAVTSNDLHGSLYVQSDGDVLPLVGSNVSFSLSGVIFRTA